MQTVSARAWFANRAGGIRCGGCAVVASASLVLLLGGQAFDAAAGETAGAPAVPAFRAPEVVVSATRSEARAFDLPLAIDTVDAERIGEGRPRVDLSESLDRVPGLVARNRHSYARDLQVSSRGFGARTAFGVRGVRLVVDGIPLTMPDGQGQTGTVSLGSAGRIEVLRGPFAGLYGNASGGVIRVFTEDPPDRPEVRFQVGAGGDGARRTAIGAAGSAGPLGYLVDASRFHTDGHRAHSGARREQLNARLRARFADGSSLALVANALDEPESRDPLGLTRAQFEEDPRQAAPPARLYDTRKAVRHVQAGVAYERSLSGGDRLRLSAYGGSRDVRQYLSIPLFVQVAATSSGGVVDLDRGFAGVGLRYTGRRGGETGLRFTAGVEHNRMAERRRGYLNVFGTAGALKRDEDDRVTSTDVFGILEWTPAPRWVIAGGVRAGRVAFESRDRFVVPGNPDDSGTADYDGTSTALGVLYRLSPRWHAYANAGTGFETPTFTELAYRNAGTGLNLALGASRSRQVEAGLKADLEDQRLRFAAFAIETRDEIVVDAAGGGRTTYRNAARTERIGLELSWEAYFANGFEASLAWTAIDARHAESFLAGSPATLVPAGNRVPGVPSHSLYGELVWRHAPSGFHAGVELRVSGRVAVDDANTEYADSHAIGSVRAGFEQRARGWRARQFVRVDNVADRDYVAAVVVGDGNGRYYEPGPGRTWWVGAELVLQF